MSTLNKNPQKNISQFFKRKRESDVQGNTNSCNTVTPKSPRTRLSLKKKKKEEPNQPRGNNILQKEIIDISDEENIPDIYEKKTHLDEHTEPKVEDTNIVTTILNEWDSPQKTPEKLYFCNRLPEFSEEKNSCFATPTKLRLTPTLTVDDVISPLSSPRSSFDSPMSFKTSGLVSPHRTPTPSPGGSSQKSWHTPYVNLDKEEILQGKKSTPTTPRSLSKRAQNTSLFKNSPGPSVRRKILTPESSPTKDYRAGNGFYLDNFLHIIESVTSYPQDFLLFNDEDIARIEGFSDLSLQAKKLYVRLFQRKVKWNKYYKIQYKDICENEDISLYLNELKYAGFIYSEDSLTDTSEALNLLERKDLTKLAKDFKVKSDGKKEEVIQNLQKIGRQQRTIQSMFNKTSTGNSMLMKKAKELVGHCFIVNKISRDVFMRILVLYSLPNFGEDEDSGQQSQLTTLLMIKLGRLKYPSYNTTRCHAIFTSRGDLINFVEYQQLETEARDQLSEKKWDEVLWTCSVAKAKLDLLMANKEIMDHESALPAFLRKYTTVSLLLYTWTHAVEAHQRLKQYDKAVAVLEELLKQKTHMQDGRGHWSDRLALNYQQHLNMPQKALQIIQHCLSDPEIMVGHQLALSQRAERILKSKKAIKFADDYKGRLNIVTVGEVPKVTIEGECVLHDSTLGKRIYVGKSLANSPQKLISSVEEYVLSYYRNEGFSEGLHHEAATVHVLFGLLFWQCIYSDVPDAFRSPHQATPLDLDSPHFYSARKDIFDERLDELRGLTLEQVYQEVDLVWTEHQNEVSIINWTVFRDVDHVKSLIVCMPMQLIIAICKRLIMNHRFTRSGFPDLIVWNIVEKQCSILEVKGPNDKLSTKQILWIQYLNANGGDAKVCHVAAVSSKKLKDRELDSILSDED